MILGWAAGLSQEHLLQHLREPDRSLDDDIWSATDRAAVRRAAGEPVAYILGRKEFWGLDFAVDARTLVPRPESELLVERAAERLLDRSGTVSEPHRVIDCCTGSGCIGIALAHELAVRGCAVELWLSDIDPQALQVAHANAERLLSDRRAVRWQVVQSDLMDRVSQTGIDCIVANPPYLTTYATEQTLRHRGWGEPQLALDGGTDGLALYPRLLQGAAARLTGGGYLIVECGDDQTARIAAMLRETGYHYVNELCDLAAKPRAVEAQTR